MSAEKAQPQRYFARWWQRWLQRRIPAARSVTLDQRRIFIFPTRTGFFFLLSLAVMLLAAINYQNNMAFALVFFLFSLSIVAILHTFSNLAGISIDAMRAMPAFAGDSVEFELKLRRTDRRARYLLELGWREQPLITTELVDVDTATVRLFHSTVRRGWLRPQRLLVKTIYPLGLLRAWSWIDLDMAAIVYPRAIEGPRPDDEADNTLHGERMRRAGNEDFYDFRRYRPGDNLRHVVWRAYAKGQPLQSKQFAETRLQSHWLRYDALDGDRERRLSVLCYCVLELHRRGELFGLQLPGQQLQPDGGDEHRERALRLLALFGQSQQPPRSESDR